MDRVGEEIFWIVVVLLSVLIGVVAYVGTTTTDSPADNSYQLIRPFELDRCADYKVNYNGQKSFTNCHGSGKDGS